MTPYSRSIPLLAILWMMASPVCGYCQGRFQKGDLKGFAISSTEHIIVELEEPIRAQRIDGVILYPGDNPMPNALFEIRGPGLFTVVKGAKTDQDGRFRLKHVARGTYKFKVTFGGFQSVVGTLILMKKPDSGPIKITLPVGV